MSKWTNIWYNKICSKKNYWKAHVSLYLESTEILRDAYIKFPRYYKGGKIKNKNYKIITYENITLKESKINWRWDIFKSRFT